jgi:hypothetical protein
MQGHPKILFQTREKYLEAPPLHSEPLRTLGQSLRAGGGLPHEEREAPKACTAKTVSRAVNLVATFAALTPGG